MLTKFEVKCLKGLESVVVTVYVGNVSKSKSFLIEDFNRLKEWNVDSLKDQISTLAHHASDEWLRLNKQDVFALEDLYWNTIGED